MEYSTPSTDLYTQVALRTITAGPTAILPIFLYFLSNVHICYDHSGAYCVYTLGATDTQTACASEQLDYTIVFNKQV